VLHDLHVDTALSYAQVAKIHRALDAPGRAAAGYKRATALLVELVGWEDRRTLAFGTQLAVAYAADRRPVAAVRVLEEILANLPAHHPVRPSVQALRDQFPF
jgi:hypothetical protein